MRLIDAVEKYKEILKEEILDCLDVKVDKNNVVVLLFNDLLSHIAGEDGYPVDNTEGNKNKYQNILSSGLSKFFSEFYTDALTESLPEQNHLFTGFEIKQFIHEGWSGDSLMFVFELEEKNDKSDTDI